MDGEFIAVVVAVTEGDFVLLDAWSALEPEKELARLPRVTIVGAEIVDARGEPVKDDAIDPQELDHPPDGYTLALRRADANITFPPVGFLFHSGEPAMIARDRFLEHLVRDRGVRPG